MKVDQQSHPCCNSALRQCKTVRQAVLGVASAGPDTDSSKICAMVLQDCLEFCGSAAVLISPACILQVDERGEVRSTVGESSDRGEERENCDEDKSEETHSWPLGGGSVHMVNL